MFPATMLPNLAESSILHSWKSSFKRNYLNFEMPWLECVVCPLASGESSCWRLDAGIIFLRRSFFMSANSDHQHTCDDVFNLYWFFCVMNLGISDFSSVCCSRCCEVNFARREGDQSKPPKKPKRLSRGRGQSRAHMSIVRQTFSLD